MKVYVAFLCVAVCTTLVNCSKQRVQVIGQFTCGNRPSVGNETWTTLTRYHHVLPSTELQRQNPDREGRVRLTGDVDSVLTFHPQVWIHTECDDNMPCHRRLKVTIPESYVYNPDQRGQEKTFDMGTMNLLQRLPGEDRNCIGNK